MMKLPVKLMPRLELAPKLNRPLSLWNPLDYLRLLYWIFYFPQALQWYIKTFGTVHITKGQNHRHTGITLLRTDPIQRNLWFQGLLIALVTSSAVGYLLIHQNLSINGDILYFYLSLMLLGTVFCGWIGGIAESLMVCVGLSLAGGLMLLLFQEDEGLLFRFATGWCWGLVFSAFESVNGGFIFPLRSISIYVYIHLAGIVVLIAPTILIGSFVSILTIPIGTLSLSNVIDSLYELLSTAFMGLGVAMGASIACLRPDTWLIGTLVRNPLCFPHITLLPLPWLTTQLRNRLRADWDDGLQQCQNLLTYSHQLISVVNAVNAELAQSAESHLIWRVSRLAHYATDWRLVGLVSVSLKDQLLATSQQSWQMTFMFWKFDQGTSKKLASQPITEPLRLDTLPRAAAAGFWYLHEKEPAQAAQAFNQVRHILYGEELYAIAHCLHLCKAATRLEQLQALQIPPYPELNREQCLRPTTWDAIATLDYVTQEVRLNMPTVNENTRAQAIVRAQFELQQLLEYAEQIPEAERGLIVDIATTWQKWFDMVLSALFESSQL